MVERGPNCRSTCVFTLRAALLLALLTLGPCACSDEPAANQEKPPAAAAPASQAQPVSPAKAATPPVNPVTQAAVQSGVLTCVSRINQVMTFLTANTTSHAYLFMPQKQADQSLFSVSLATKSLDGAAKYATASFAPTTSGRAAAVYDSVQYVTEPPEAVEKSVFKDYKRKGVLGKDVIMLDGGPVTVFLMPAGTGCIVIKKEVVQ